MRTTSVKKILIADPSGESRRSLGEFLRGKGLEVIEASDGNAALAETLRRRPDLIVLDLAVGMLAPERFAGILHANPNTKGIPILFLGSGGQGIAGFRPGTDEFLKRPFPEEDLFQRIRSLLSPEVREIPSRNELIPPEDLAQLRSRRKERDFSEEGAIERIACFLPHPSSLEAVVGALGGFPEFEPERSFFALQRQEGFPIGAFGRVRGGDGASLLLYSFPYLQSTSPVWYAVAPRPLGILALLADEAADSLDGLMAVSEYARGANAGCVLALLKKTSSDFGIGRNTLRLFRNHLEKLGCVLRVQEMEELSGEEIRRAMTGIVRQYLGEG